MAAEHEGNEKERKTTRVERNRWVEKQNLKRNMKLTQSPLVTHLVLTVCVCVCVSVCFMRGAVEARGFLYHSIGMF